MGVHARLSPSDHTWPNCPGSVREQSKYPDIPNAASIDGTGSHILLEECLKQNKLPIDFKGLVLGTGHEDKPTGWLIDTDRIKRVQNIIAYIDRRKTELTAEYKGCTVKVEAESKSNPGKYVNRDDWFGTADVTIVVQTVKGETLYVEVVDYKNGQLFVPVEDNSQLISYLSGKLFEYGLSKGVNRMTIVQPKTKPIIRYTDEHFNDLMVKFNELCEAAKRTDDPNAPCVPDNKDGKGWCRWCKHRDNCEALKKGVLKKMTGKTEDPKMTNLFDMFNNIENMTGDEIADKLDCEKFINDGFTLLKKEAEKRIKNGETVGHYRMKPGKGSNNWKIPETEMYKVLQARGIKKDEAYISKFISVAQVMKLDKLTDQQKKKLEEKYIEYTPGNPKLTRMSEKEIESSAMDLMREASQEVKQQEFSFL